MEFKQAIALFLIVGLTGALFVFSTLLQTKHMTNWVGSMNGNYAKIFAILFFAFLLSFAFDFRRRQQSPEHLKHESY